MTFKPDTLNEQERLKYECARQLGLLPQERSVAVAPGERPTYTDEDVYKMMDYDPSFKGLYEEVQRLLGRSLNNEELKILLGFVRYLCLDYDVISVLVSYCKARLCRICQRMM